jgi:hypothetical protein
MGLPSNMVSDRDSRFISHLWQRTDESPRYQAIEVHRLPSTSRRPTRRLGRTSPARPACIQHRRIRDNQDVAPSFANYGYQPETQWIRPAASEANFTYPASELLLAHWNGS